MTDKKLTDSEIKKALEESISFDEPYESDFTLIRIEYIKNALDLINRLRAENKRLSTLAELGNTRANDYRVMRDRALKAEAENSNLTSDLTSLKNYLISADVENERLKIRLRKAEHQLDDAMKMYNTIKAEAYKEFAERLKERPTADKDVQYVFELKIDNLLKELEGNSNVRS